MTAAALPFRIFDLVKNQAEAKPLQRFARVFFAYQAIPNFLADLAVRHFEKSFNDFALMLSDRTLSMERMVEKLDAEPTAELIDEDGELGDQLTATIGRLRDLAEKIRPEGINVDGASLQGRRWKVRKSVERVHQSAFAAAAAAVDLRAALDSHDANVEAIRRARSGAQCILAASDAELSDQLDAACKR